ncbi:MAG TPA: GNAT family N-acetyltransferase [Candidatus Competibacter sp.]|nr:GNAT family N-acetyltransferase [Candidatus Competibacter sp.]
MRHGTGQPGMKIKNEDYHIRDYRPGDEQAIVGLFDQVFGKRLTENQWRWKYVADGSIPPLRLAFDASGRLAGHAGAIPLRGWRRGRPLPFFQICDVMVHPDARGGLGDRNLFARLVRGLLGGVAERWPDAFAYGFPGQRPYRLGERTRVYGEVERARVVHRPARRNLLPLLGVRALDWNDARLNGLWMRLAPGFRLALIRDGDYLRWRYAANPFHAYRLLGLYWGTRLFGWAVVRSDHERLLIVDLLAPRRWLRLALAALDRIAASEGVGEVDIWLPGGWREAAGKRVESTEVVVTNMVWGLQIPTADVRDELYYTMGDLDIF